MKRPKFLVLSMVVLLISFKSIKPDVSDDECGVDDTEKEFADIPRLADKPVTSSVSPQSHKTSKKVEKKSLLIVFDGTSSMGADLTQMRDAAKKLITELSERKDKPIKNYVLTVFKDPSRFGRLIIRQLV